MSKKNTELNDILEKLTALEFTEQNEKYFGILKEISQIKQLISNNMANANVDGKVNTEEQIYCKEDEYTALQCLNTEKLASFFAEKFKTEKSVLLGHYAATLKELLGENCSFATPCQAEKLALIANKADYFCPKYFDVTLPTSDNCGVINPALSQYLAYEGNVSALYRQIKEKLVLLAAPKAKEDIQIFWSEGFFAPEALDGGKFFRWCTDISEANYINVRNNTNKIISAKINFNVSSPVANGKLQIKLNAIEETAQLNGNGFGFNKEITLQPGDNIIKIIYEGDFLAVENDWRVFYFRIDDFALNIEGTPMDIAKGYGVYGSAKLPYSCVSDYVMRKKLHKNGFFDVISYEVDEDTNITKCETSKFVSNTDSFKITESLKPTSEGNYRIYIAKRKGEFVNE